MLSESSEKKSRYLFYSVSTTLIFIYICISALFVWHDNLSTFASDSANYMLMALYMSPWEDASEPIQALWQFQDFPPLFPFILAITGAAHSMNMAHILTLFFLIISIPLIYIFSRKCFASNWQALAITGIFLFSPSTWLNILGILSENLYIFISFLIIVLFPKQNILNIYFSLLLGLLITLLILTRTIGISMFIAYIIIASLMWHSKSLSTVKFISPIIVTIILSLLVKTLNDSSVPTQYLQQLDNLDISGQPRVLFETWFSSWQFYWVDDLIIPQIFVSIIGMFACIGLTIRLKLLKLDAFYVLVYLCILLVWPHPGQALRFIYPIYPILIVYSFYSIYIISKRFISIKPEKPVSILLLISFTVIGPTLSYLWNRYNLGKEDGYNKIHEFYRLPDLGHAKYIASIQKVMFDDMKIIENMTNENDVILHFSPVYIALLANRHSNYLAYKYKDENLNYINDINKANYAYITKIHPRRTGKDFKGEGLQVYFNGQTEELWTHHSEYNGNIASTFLRVIK